MKFSVLIPVYNTEKYLEECLENLLHQTYQDVEIVLVDDGSTDGSGAICDAYQSGYPERVKAIHQNNAGQLASRINAIRAAEGTYCMFADADDLLDLRALETVYENVMTYHYPDLVFFPFYYDREGNLEKSRLFSETTKVYQAEDVIELRKAFFSDILLNSVWTKAVKREVLLKSIGDYHAFSSLRYAEDRLQSMWILDAVQSAVYCPVPLYQYRLFAGSTTRTFTYDSISKYNTEIVFAEEMKYLNKWGLNAKQWLEWLYAYYIAHVIYVFDLFYCHITKENRKQVIDYPWKSFVPAEILQSPIENNPLVPPVHQELFRWIIENDEKKIEHFYFQKKISQSLKRIKRRFMKKDLT